MLYEITSIFDDKLINTLFVMSNIILLSIKFSSTGLNATSSNQCEMCMISGQTHNMTMSLKVWKQNKNCYTTLRRQINIIYANTSDDFDGIFIFVDRTIFYDFAEHVAKIVSQFHAILVVSLGFDFYIAKYYSVYEAQTTVVSNAFNFTAVTVSIMIRKKRML